ncbi:sterol desaturase family protein (plasmid) [Bradyrhizobium oligotrophicum S58]
MPRNFGVSRRDLPRAFDLSAGGYFLDFLLVPLAIAALIWAFGCRLEALAAGVLAWTFAEYWIHRLIFHGPTRFAPMHEMHHRLPKDWIGAASWLTLPAFAVVFGLLALAMTRSAAASATAGLMAGYLAYCAVHIRIHHGRRARFWPPMAFLHRLHAGHHRGGRANYGVSSPLWDIVFRSFKP